MKNPSLLKSFSLRTFGQSFFFSALLFAVIACFYRILLGVDIIMNPMDYAAIFGFIFFFGLLQWMFQKNTLSKLLADKSFLPKTQKTFPSTTQDIKADFEKQKNKEKRLFVHLFTVLQRQGRLMDFLHEDLTRY